MKNKFAHVSTVLAFILLLTAASAQASQSSSAVGARALDTTLTILRAESVRSLADIARSSEMKRRHDRACEIQRQKKLIPSLCYSIALENGDADAQLRTLDSECRHLSRTATELPGVDRFTSKACREAIESRAQDLAYVEKRNASR